MIRFVGYRQDSITRDLIFEGVEDTNWARAVSANSGNTDRSPVFFLIDFKNKTARITDTTTGETDTLGIDAIPIRADYLGVVMEEMDAELDALINEHGVTEPR